MNAVVVELNKNHAAILSDDGRITTIKNNNYVVGQIIQLNKSKVNIVRKITALAASAAAFVVISAGTWAYASPYSYVSVDVNPSIEFIINRFDRVIKVNAVNDDAENILNQISLKDLKNKTITDAIVKTVDEISAAGYFEGNTTGGIVVATSSKNSDKADELTQELENTVEQETGKNGDEVVVDSFHVDMERYQEAKALGVTPGKLNLVKKLQEAAGKTAEINLEDWLNKPVKEIMKATKDYKNSAKIDKNTSQTTDDAAFDDQENPENQEIQKDQGKDNKTDNKDNKKSEKASDKIDKASSKSHKIDKKESPDPNASTLSKDHNKEGHNKEGHNKEGNSKEGNRKKVNSKEGNRKKVNSKETTNPAKENQKGSEQSKKTNSKEDKIKDKTKKEGTKNNNKDSKNSANLNTQNNLDNNINNNEPSSKDTPIADQGVNSNGNKENNSSTADEPSNPSEHPNSKGNSGHKGTNE